VKREKIFKPAAKKEPKPQTGPSLMDMARECHERNDRINFVEQLMLNGLFQKMRSEYALAVVWEVKPDTVKDYAREANGRLEREVQPEDILQRKHQLLGYLDRIKHESLLAGNHAAGVSAAKLEASILGLLIHKVEMKGSMDMFAGWTDLEVQEYAEIGKVPNSKLKLQ
tara:strand:+ start:1083 stop:1589 length:507 start_codon:yes stop_codon:yes gene_type:complete